MKAIFSFKLLLLSALGILGLPAKADPTRPPTLAGAGVNAGAERAEQALMLQLIIKKADGYRAMLNGQMVKAGDRDLPPTGCLTLRPNASFWYQEWSNTTYY
ncbi:hypothetical protein [Alishewanella longhuensis]